MNEEEKPPADGEEKPDEAPPPNPELEAAKAKIAELEKAAQDTAPLVEMGRAAKRAAFIDRFVGKNSTIKDGMQAAFDAVLTVKLAEHGIDLATATALQLNTLAEELGPMLRPLIQRPAPIPSPSGANRDPEEQHPYSRIKRDF